MVQERVGTTRLRHRIVASQAYTFQISADFMRRHGCTRPELPTRRHVVAANASAETATCRWAARAANTSRFIRQGISTGLLMKVTRRGHIWPRDFVSDITARGSALGVYHYVVERAFI